MTWISTWWNYLPIYCPTHLIMILAAAILANHCPRTCISASTWNHSDWFEKPLCSNNFNGWCNQVHMHMALAWCVINISCTIHWHLFSDVSPFHSPAKEKGKQWRMMKGLIMAQWINLNLNIRSVLACRYTKKQVDIIISKNQLLQIQYYV